MAMPKKQAAPSKSFGSLHSNEINQKSAGDTGYPKRKSLAQQKLPFKE